MSVKLAQDKPPKPKSSHTRGLNDVKMLSNILLLLLPISQTRRIPGPGISLKLADRSNIKA
ncbi:hypothetical protein [Shewanella algae]|uniref:hypothetical protein n=1 Tax=Shewanella algae TaxID=38313 RepID=UPI003C5F5EF6